MSKTFRAIAVLVGTTIGAGIFGIPFVVSRIGFWPGFFYILILGILNLFLNLVYGEITLRTRGDHQLTGYGTIYLGKTGKVLATIALFLSLYGAILAYLIKIGEFVSLVLGIEAAVIFSLLFFIVAAIAVFFGLRTVSFLEGIILFFLLGQILLIAFLGLGRIRLGNFSGFNLSYFFLPYGVILFALTGSSVVPEMEEILRKEHQNLKKSIIVGSLIPLFVYLLFATIIVGISGVHTSDDAISGLALFLPSWIVKMGAFLGILSMGSSFLTLGYVLKETWYRDFKLSKITSLCLALFPPLILFLLGTKSFIGVLGVTGALTGGLIGIIIIRIFLAAKNKGQREPAFSLKLPRALVWILFLIFFLGMISPLLQYL